MSGGYGKGFLNEVALELGIEVWRGPGDISYLRDSQKSIMEGNGFREG